jgi:hypothetical protein
MEKRKYYFSEYGIYERNCEHFQQRKVEQIIFHVPQNAR